MPSNLEIRGCILKNFMKKSLTVAVVLALHAGYASASDAAGEFHGYLRAGVGENTKQGSQACFQDPGASQKYRFGNECDTYAEFEYRKELVKSDNGASFVGTIMTNFYEPNSTAAGKNFGLAEMMVEAKNLDFLQGGIAWAGKRYYNRPDIHVLDLQLVNMDGVGAGIDAIPMGPGRFGYALMRNDNIEGLATSSATRHQFLYHGVPVNHNGSLNFDVTLITANAAVAEASGGYALSVAHNQNEVLGGTNTFWLQHAKGAGAAVKSGALGDIFAGSSNHQSRIADMLVWQFTPNVTGSVNALYQRNRTLTGVTTWTSIGARPSYALNDNLKLVLDFGHDAVRPDSGDTRRLTKISFAPVLTTGKGFWSRPELRAFVTYAKWNDAAQRAAPAGDPLSSSGVFGSAKRGLSYGVQTEAWW